LAILFRPFGLLAPKTFKLFGFPILVIYVFIEGKNVNSIIEINIYTFCTYNVRPVSGITFFMYAHNQKIGKPKYQVKVITVFTVFQFLTDFVCLYNYEF
jgi:hypothetical protein